MGKNRFDKYTYGFLNGIQYDFCDKKTSINNHVSYMLNRTQSMFKYEGLPDSIPERVLELYLQTNGHVCFYDYKDVLYIFTGGFGGIPDVYYMPTEYIITNPYLKLSKTVTIDKECVIIPNDSLYIGLMPLYEKYATALCENEISMNIATINSRIVSLISSGDDRTTKSAEKYLQDIIDGKIGVIGENAFLEGVKSQPYGTTANSNSITNLIEYEQYLKASWYNEIGLNANYNMKRESINSGESQLNNDMLLPLIDNMLTCREIGIQKVNNMFGTNISVSLSSSWEDNAEEIELEHNAIIDNNENQKGGETSGNETTE